MRKIQSLFEKQLSFVSLLCIIPLFIVGNILYCECVIHIEKVLFPDLYRQISSATASDISIKKIGVPGIVICAGIEEAIFRLFPLVIIQLLFFPLLKEKGKTILLLSSVVILSVLFGYLHGNVLNITLQGVAGLFFSVLYLKRGGYWNNDPVKGLCSSTAAHALFNIVLVYGLKT